MKHKIVRMFLACILLIIIIFTVGFKVLPQKKGLDEVIGNEAAGNKVDYESIYHEFLSTKVNASLEPVELKAFWYGGGSFLDEFLPEDRKGIVATKLSDLNYDSIPELLVVESKSFADSTTSTEETVDITWCADGIEIKVFTIKNEQVVEMKTDNLESISYEILLSMVKDNYFHVQIIEENNKYYILIFNAELYCEELSNIGFNYDLYEIQDNSIHCVNKMSEYGGTVYNSHLGEESESVFCYSEDGANNIYEFLSAAMGPINIDFVENYYKGIKEEEIGFTSTMRCVNSDYTIDSFDKISFPGEQIFKVRGKWYIKDDSYMQSFSFETLKQ